jgi:hypothetical protein
LPITGDDYRRDEDPRHNHRVDEIVKVLSQGAYGDADEGKGSRDGGVQGSAGISSPVLLAAETTHPGAAITSRQVIARLRDGTIPLSPQGEVPIDRYIRCYLETGLAGMMLADFLRYFAGRIDERGQAALTRWAERQRQVHYRRYAGARAAETVAYARMGWDAIFQWARHYDLLDLLPSPEKVDAALERLQRYGEAASAAADHKRQILDSIGEAIRSGRMHLLAHDHTVPVFEPILSGWQRTGTTADGDGKWTPRGATAGYWSQDRRHILVTPAGLREAIRDNEGLRGLTAEQRNRALSQAADQQLSGVDKCSIKLGLKNRIRGWVFTPAQLGYDDGSADEDDLPDEALAQVETELVADPFEDEYPEGYDQGADFVI